MLSLLYAYALLYVVFATGDLLARTQNGMSDEEYSRTYMNISIEYDTTNSTVCKTAFDCSFNGDCVNNICTCYPQWMGPFCAVLNLKPTNKTYGYQYTINGQRVSSWGGAVVMDDDGNYHMYAAELSMYCGINAWQPNSILIHAQSNINKEGISKYIRKDEIDTIFSHEPDAIRAPTGEYVIYYSHNYPPPTGTINTTPCTDCTDGITIDCTEAMKHVHPYIIYTYMIYSTNPNGPWSQPQVIPTNITIDSNLAGYIYPNGSFIGVFRTGSEISGMYASNWKNNQTYKYINIVLNPPNRGEDPFMWYDKRTNVLHTIWHAGGWGMPFGYHRFSIDGGYTWNGYDYNIQAYNNSVYFNDGDIIHYQRMERPHLIFDSDGYTPIALTNGAEQASLNQQFYPDYTYTLLRPINQH
eukprot:375188_1